MLQVSSVAKRSISLLHMRLPRYRLSTVVVVAGRRVEGVSDGSFHVFDHQLTNCYVRSFSVQKDEKGSVYCRHAILCTV